MYIQQHTQCSLTAIHTCHCTRIPVGHVLIERRCLTKHCKKREGCNKGKKDQTHHTNNNKRSRFKPQTKKEKERVRLVNRRNSRCRIYVQQHTTHHNGATERERESTLTALHSCHRPCIPGGHVLIERRCGLKHCKKREGCNKEKKDQTHRTNNNEQGPVSNHNQKQEQHV